MWTCQANPRFTKLAGRVPSRVASPRVTRARAIVKLLYDTGMILYWVTRSCRALRALLNLIHPRRKGVGCCILHALLLFLRLFDLCGLFVIFLWSWALEAHAQEELSPYAALACTLPTTLL